MDYAISYDIGTTGVKTCLFSLDKSITLVASANKGYGLYVLDNGGVEQDEEEWLAALKATTQKVLEESRVDPSAIVGLSFSSQMQALILVDREGKAVHHPMSYMDQRGSAELKEGLSFGPQIAGANVLRLAKSLYYTGAVSTSAKDPVWKYKWLEKHEKEAFSKGYA